MQYKRWLVIPALLFAACAAIWYFCKGGYEFEEDARSGGYVITNDMDAGEWSRNQEEASAVPVQIQINGMPEADASSGRCSLMAGNPAENGRDLLITVTLDESGETIYESPVLKPGERIAYVTIDPVPEPGEYSATAEFTVLHPETGERLGAVDAGIFLAVK